jgi:flagellar biosynthesis activator protein FlaF
VYKNPLQAYQEVDKSGMSGRDVEAYALTKAAIALRECQNNWNSPERDQLLEHALKLNQRVWSIFQAELTRADNPMPLPIKQNILKLGVFIDRRIIEVLSDPKSEALKIIISINENLAAGLRESVGSQEDDNDLTPAADSLFQSHF